VCVRVRVCGPCPGHAQVIMEYADGGTLLQYINRGVFNANPERGVATAMAAMKALVACAQEVAAGMAHLHSLNIIHGERGGRACRGGRGGARGVETWKESL
jgi:hypothetical protein